MPHQRKSLKRGIWGHFGERRIRATKSRQQSRKVARVCGLFEFCMLLKLRDCSRVPPPALSFAEAFERDLRAACNSEGWLSNLIWRITMGASAQDFAECR